MRHEALSRILRVTAVVICVLRATSVPAHEDAGRESTIPIRVGQIRIRGTGAEARVSFAGRWRGETPAIAPFETPATLRIFGGFGGDTGAIRLDPARWRQTAKGWRYADASRAAGGIEQIAVRMSRNGGALKVVGGGAKWLYEAGDVPATSLTVVLAVGEHQWCAQFAKPKRRAKGPQVKAATRSAPRVLPSTWAGIQAIFDRNGCLNAACHGAPPFQGDLDLRPDVAYRNLVDAPSDRGGKKRVQPGSRQDSFLWEKLAAGAAGFELGGRGSPMPVGLPPVTADELEALRLWIQFGAPETGVVLGTEQVLGACVPSAEPSKIAPPAPPPASEGVQFHAPPWVIPAANATTGLNGEGEVCYATYYDVSSSVPDEFETPCPEFWGGPSRTCFFFNRSELTQEPNSHHSIIHMYKGAFDPTWEPSMPGDTTGFRFRCHGGALDGTACDPRLPDACGAGVTCHGEAVSSIVCIGYGPPDFNRGFSPNGAAGTDNAPSVGGSQQPFLRNAFPGGAFGVFPTDGVIVWNSHAFNLFEEPATNEQWWNVFFAREADRQVPVRTIFDATDIFVQDVPPFAEREYCRTITFPVGTRIFQFSSHTHERGRLFRLWGPGIEQSCRSTSGNPDACTAEPSAPIIVTTEYNDPTVLVRNESPWVLDDPDPRARRFKFCAIFDNGFTDPSTVKRNSTSPVPPQFGNLAPGGKCRFASIGGAVADGGIACLNGPRRGAPCEGDDRQCDSSPGAGDGLCDACPLTGGVTTDDEMFILLGSYVCLPGSDCEAGVCVAGPNRGMRCDGDDARCPGSACGPYGN